MEFAEVEFKLDVKAFFDTYFHFDWFVANLIRFHSDVSHDEFFFLGDSIVIPVDNDIDVIPQPNNDTIVALKLLFNSVELKIILNIVCERAWRLKISHNLKESRILFAIE